VTFELAKTIAQGWGTRRGKPPGDLAYEHFVTRIQNHDQVGNRALGTRLSDHVDAEAFCSAVALLLFLPATRPPPWCRPQAPSTFEASKLRWSERNAGAHVRW
jgi:hypothetical protein